MRAFHIYVNRLSSRHIHVHSTHQSSASPTYEQELLVGIAVLVFFITSVFISFQNLFLYFIRHSLFRLAAFFPSFSSFLNKRVVYE